MSITTRCTECDATSLDGVLAHTKSCSATSLRPVVGHGIMPPALELKFGSPEEQAEWMRKLSGSQTNTTPQSELVQHPSNNIEAEIGKILWQVERDYIVESPILLTNAEIRDKAKTALKNLISQATVQERIDELEDLQAADMRLYTNPLIKQRLATLQNQSKGNENER